MNVKAKTELKGLEADIVEALKDDAYLNLVRLSSEVERVRREGDADRIRREALFGAFWSMISFWPWFELHMALARLQDKGYIGLNMMGEYHLLDKATASEPQSAAEGPVAAT